MSTFTVGFFVCEQSTCQWWNECCPNVYETLLDKRIRCGREHHTYTRAREIESVQRLNEWSRKIGSSIEWICSQQFRSMLWLLFSIAWMSTEDACRFSLFPLTQIERARWYVFFCRNISLSIVLKNIFHLRQSTIIVNFTNLEWVDFVWPLYEDAENDVFWQMSGFRLFYEWFSYLYFQCHPIITVNGWKQTSDVCVSQVSYCVCVCIVVLDSCLCVCVCVIVWVIVTIIGFGTGMLSMVNDFSLPVMGNYYANGQKNKL